MKRAAEFEFWVRANPLMSKLSFSLNGGPETLIDLNGEKREPVNVADDDKPDLRFLAWSKVGKVALQSGTNTIRFRMTSENNHHGYLDCFVGEAIDDPLDIGMSSYYVKMRIAGHGR